MGVIAAVFLIPKGQRVSRPPRAHHASGTLAPGKTFSKVTKTPLNTEKRREQEAAEKAATRSSLHSVKPEPRSILSVRSYPSRAQVLLFVGRSPVLVQNLPAGVVHEFVALSDQGRSWRAVAALDRSGSRCMNVNDRPDSRSTPKDPVPLTEKQQGARPPGVTETSQVCEIVIDIEGREIHRPLWDLGPTLLPREVGQLTGPLGAVRVITQPAGLNVYQLVGFTPDARIDNLSVEQASELLIYASGHQIEKVKVAPNQWRTGIPRTASLDISLKTRYR